MDENVAGVARAAAKRLAGELGPRLEMDVETALAEAAPRLPTRSFDPTVLSAGTLVVAVAGLAWQVYRDLRARGETPTRDAVARRVRVGVRVPQDMSDRDAQVVVEVVVDEVVNAEEIGP